MSKGKVRAPDAAWIRRELPICEVAAAVGLQGDSRYYICFRCKRRKLGVHIKSNTARCFKCDTRGLSPIDLARAVLGLDTGAAIRWLAQRFPVIPQISLSSTPQRTPWPQPSVEAFITSPAWPELSHAAKAVGCWILVRTPASPEVEPVLETTWTNIARGAGIKHRPTVGKILRELESRRLIALGVAALDGDSRGFGLKRTVIRLTWALFVDRLSEVPESELCSLKQSSDSEPTVSNPVRITSCRKVPGAKVREGERGERAGGDGRSAETGTLPRAAGVSESEKRGRAAAARIDGQSVMASALSAESGGLAGAAADAARLRTIIGAVLASFFSDYTRHLAGRPYAERLRHFVGELTRRSFKLQPSERDALAEFIREIESREATSVASQHGGNGDED